MEARRSSSTPRISGTGVSRRGLAPATRQDARTPAQGRPIVARQYSSADDPQMTMSREVSMSRGYASTARVDIRENSSQACHVTCGFVARQPFGGCQVSVRWQDIRCVCEHPTLDRAAIARDHAQFGKPHDGPSRSHSQASRPYPKIASRSSFVRRAIPLAASPPAAPTNCSARALFAF